MCIVLFGYSILVVFTLNSHSFTPAVSLLHLSCTCCSSFLSALSPQVSHFLTLTNTCSFTYLYVYSSFCWNLFTTVWRGAQGPKRYVYKLEVLCCPRGSLLLSWFELVLSSRKALLSWDFQSLFRLMHSSTGRPDPFRDPALLSTAATKDLAADKFYLINFFCVFVFFLVILSS